MAIDLPDAPVPRLRALVQQLCAPACGGRAAGTREGEAARHLLEGVLEDIGLQPAGPVGFLQPVPGCGGANLLGRVPGTGGGKDERHVLVCAHYDHLGWHSPGRDAYWGADDNAAAVAIAVEVGLQLARRPDGLRRAVTIMLFDGEEPPFFLTRGMGSEHYVRHPTVPLSSIDLMVCMDLVGHALGQPGHPAALRQGLLVLGAEKSAGTAALCDGLPAVPGVAPLRLGINLLPPLSDYHPFQARQVPFLFLTCGRWRHYHQVTDTPDRLDYGKMAAIARWVEALVRQAAQRPEAPVRFLPEAQDDQASLRTLYSCLSLLAPWWGEGRDALRLIERLVTERAADPERQAAPLGPEEFSQVLMVLAQLEAQLA